MATSHQPPLQNVAASDFRWLLVLRIAASEHFRTSPRLCELLLYICDCAIRELPSEVTEQQIGTKVFGRPPGYNASEDNIVRSQARLLRLKLEAYFASEGLTEDFIMEVPRGHYLPVFRKRVRTSQVTDVDVQKSETDPSALSPNIRMPGVKTKLDGPFSRRLKIGVALAMFAAVVAAVWFLEVRTAPAENALETFWRPFFTADPALVIYSNAPFVRDGMMGLLRLPQDPALNQTIIDDYTGTGEVVGVHQLTKLFDAHRATFVLKRSRLVTWDEARTRNLIFVGSATENTALRELPDTTEFTFGSPSAKLQELTVVLNHNPKPGEQKEYLRAEQRPLKEDYAILALLQGLQAGHRILLLTGMTTNGTQAAAEFVCRPEAVAELLRDVPVRNGEMQSFEAVLHITIRGGVPLQTELVAIHAR
jgi:hypothetical protein